MQSIKKNVVSVITTIQPPTSCMEILSDKLKEFNGVLVVAGDTKGPFSYPLENAQFLDIKTQESSGYHLAEKLPTKHYARKNIAYLHAMRAGATCIYETDDDNKPNDKWTLRDEVISSAQEPSASPHWLNVYRYFSNENIWPRGLPLSMIKQSVPTLNKIKQSRRCPIQQGLVNNSPDVDAVWRLVLDRPFDFDLDGVGTVLIPENVWCPFNTQSTWWWSLAFPLLYIPSYCSFRMCDIWKSFVAQRCLWVLGYQVAFHPPEVIQERNDHDLSKDFEDEIPGYLQNEKITRILDACQLEAGENAVSRNLRTCYETLVNEGVFPQKELDLVDLWILDLNAEVSPNR